MKSLTVMLHQADLARLREAAARRGVSLEEAAAELVRLGLESERRIAAGIAVLDRLDREQEPVGEEEAMRIASEEVRAMRADHRGGHGP